jgi:uncharacterized protein YbjT (DUF2867 family)
MSTILNSEAKILVVGSDDICGYVIAKTFLKHLKNEVRVGYMFKDNYLTKKIEKEGAEVMRYELDDSKSMERMFEGIHCAVIVPPVYGHHYNKAKELIEVAGRCKQLKMVVMTSIINADRLSDWERLREIHKMEKKFENCMKKWDKAFILRKSMPLEGFYMVRKAIQEKHILPWALGDSKIAPVSLCDVGQAIIRLFCGKHHENDQLDTSCSVESLTRGKHMFCLTGRHKMDGKEIAKECSEALDSEIKLKSVKVDELLECLKEQEELPKEILEFLKEFFEAARKGYLSEQTHDLENILGEKPMSVEDYFEENREEFMPHK